MTRKRRSGYAVARTPDLDAPAGTIQTEASLPRTVMASRANVKRLRSHYPTPTHDTLALIFGHIVVGAAIVGILLTICSMLWLVVP